MGTVCIAIYAIEIDRTVIHFISYILSDLIAKYIIM